MSEKLDPVRQGYCMIMSSSIKKKRKKDKKKVAKRVEDLGYFKNTVTN